MDINEKDNSNEKQMIFQNLNKEINYVNYLKNMKNKRYRTLNMSSTFHKSLGLSSSCISEENFSNKEKHKFHSKTESKGYNKKQMT